MSDLWEFFVDETEWWDRVAIALDMLARKPGVRRGVVEAGGDVIDWTGNVVPENFKEGKAPAGAPAAHVYAGITDGEIIRRLTQLPDETGANLLLRPFAVFCADLNGYVAVNRPAVSPAEDLKKLKGHRL